MDEAIDKGIEILWHWLSINAWCEKYRNNQSSNFARFGNWWRGLFTPIEVSKGEFGFWYIKDTPEVASVLSAFLRWLLQQRELDYCINNAYDSRSLIRPASPLVKLDGQYNLELSQFSHCLWRLYGPCPSYLTMTTAAKNMAWKTRLSSWQTSGDTGKAAMAQLCGCTGAEIIVFYQKGTVSARCKGSCKWLLKLGTTLMLSPLTSMMLSKCETMFNIDNDLPRKSGSKQAQFSSANSMNIGRLVHVSMFMPTLRSDWRVWLVTRLTPAWQGNFGNILAQRQTKSRPTSRQ